MSKMLERQRFIRYYREQTGESEIDMHKVADLALKMGWSLPTPVDPKDLLARQFADAARQEIRKDKVSKRPYRAWHAVPAETKAAGQQLSFWWVDIDDPNTTTNNFRKSAVRRREQMIDDGVQLSLDLDHWNSMHAAEADQVNLPWDLTLDVEIRRASFDDAGDEDKAA